MTHGRVAVRNGTCPICGRVDVDLDLSGVCVDQFACSEAWAAARRRR